MRLAVNASCGDNTTQNLCCGYLFKPQHIESATCNEPPRSRLEQFIKKIIFSLVPLGFYHHLGNSY